MGQQLIQRRQTTVHYDCLIQYNHEMQEIKKSRRHGESNPGLPRDRRG